jgi:hypothetical protein
MLHPKAIRTGISVLPGWVSEAIKQSDFKAHRWVVERTHSWMNRFRRVLTRWEKKVENYEAMLHFACSIIVWNKILLG